MATFNTTSASTTVTAAEMVLRLKIALRDNPAVVSMVNVDGQQVQYSRQQAIDELEYWEDKARKEAGTRPRVARINLRGF